MRFAGCAGLYAPRRLILCSLGGRSGGALFLEEAPEIEVERGPLVGGAVHRRVPRTAYGRALRRARACSLPAGPGQPPSSTSFGAPQRLRLI